MDRNIETLMKQIYTDEADKMQEEKIRLIYFNQINLRSYPPT